VTAAAARQGGLAALYADLEVIVSQGGSAGSVPAPVIDAARQLLALRLNLEPETAVTGDDLKTALAQSGLFADLARPGVALQPNSANIATALASLRQALQNWLATAPNVASDAAEPDAETRSGPRGAVPAPPYRGSPTVAQAPVAASLPASASARAQALHLLDETDAAIARQSLLQLASLPDDSSTGGGIDHDNNAARLMFDIPLATQQGTAVAQLQIEPDGRQQGQHGAAKPVWHASFAIDLEPIGSVQVRIALAGERASVTMTAERADSAAALSASLPLLEAGLREAALEPGELRSQIGAPAPPAVTPGLFMDHAT
jgi:flagellar hook-length control protein FliK